jgi:hypothetical protein
MSARDIAQQLHRIAESVARLDHISDWVDDPDELLLSHEASRLANVSPETIRRWAETHKLGRLFAGSVWVISRQRLFRFLERRFGEDSCGRTSSYPRGDSSTTLATTTFVRDSCRRHTLKACRWAVLT